MPKIRGKYSKKDYRCTKCGHTVFRGTNHWGEIYPMCRYCNEITVHECLEPVPEGYGVPEPWKIVTLSEICEIT
jgi:DNA-directed RNA polymerase subunit RPC12/RpoP